MSRKIKSAAVWLSLLMLAALSLTKPLEARETRKVAGKYKFVVGFLNEPAFTTELNGVDLEVFTSTGGAEEPVSGLEKTLKVKVSQEGAEWSLNLKFRLRPDKAGAYAAYFIPTRSGKYIFNIRGEIEGSPVDETFESGPDTFNDVEPAEPLEYPDHRRDES